VSTEDRIKKLITNRLGIEEEQIARDKLLTDDLGADSLDIVELVMGVEEEFGIEIPDSEMEKVKTVGDVIEAVERIAR
jgi:acyl carrier protein